MQDDPRAVLGLPPDATRDEAQRAFRRLAKQTHPDTGGDPSAFRSVAGAWAELGALLRHDRRRRAPSPHLAAYRAPVSRVVWAEPRPPVRPVRTDFATLLQAEMTRLAA
jgi:molecular chaperone DnaJ